MIGTKQTKKKKWHEKNKEKHAYETKCNEVV